MWAASYSRMACLCKQAALALVSLTMSEALLMLTSTMSSSPFSTSCSSSRGFLPKD